MFYLLRVAHNISYIESCSQLNFDSLPLTSVQCDGGEKDFIIAVAQRALDKTKLAPFELLVASLCPDIFGQTRVKAGLILALLGGTQKVRSCAGSLVHPNPNPNPNPNGDLVALYYSSPAATPPPSSLLARPRVPLPSLRLCATLAFEISIHHAPRRRLFY